VLALWQFYHQSHLVANEKELDLIMNLAFEALLFTLQTYFLYVAKSYDRADGFTSPSKEGVLCGFLSPLKSIASAESEPVNLGSNGKHANHYTTDATMEPNGSLPCSQGFSSPLTPILSQMNPVHSHTSHFLKNLY
jgi:hypothetical protein